MKGRIARAIAVAAAGAMLTVAGAGMATAEDGKGTSSTEAAGAEVLELRDELTRAAYAGDVARTQDTLARMDPLLADLAAGQVYTIQAEVQRKADTAHQHAREVARILENPGATPRQVPDVPAPEIPDLPPPLSAVSGLLKGLLAAVTGLLAGLLGGDVPKLPVPETPELPAP